MHLLNPQPHFWIILQERSEPGNYTAFFESWKHGHPPDLKPNTFAQLIDDLQLCPWVKDAKIIGCQEVDLSVYPSAGDVWELICKFEKLSGGWRHWRGEYFAVVRFEDYLETFYKESVPSFILSPYQRRLFGPDYIEVWEEG